MINVRQLVAIGTFLMIVLTSVAGAANDEQKNASPSPQPYVTATQSVSGVITVDENGKLTIVQDNFVTASYPIPAQGKIVNHNPKVIGRTVYVTSTGYNSLPEQTDDSPFIAADGSHVYWGMVAANFLPFGTKIKIPEYYGDKIFIVHDRMATRFSDRVDVWFEHKSDALKWGRRTVKIEVIGS